MVDSYIPERGDIVLLNFDPQLGKEQSGRRPALVLSPHRYNSKVGLAIVCPITSQIKGYPFEVILSSHLNTHGAILIDHIKNVDWAARRVKFLEKINRGTLEEVQTKIRLLVS